MGWLLRRRGPARVGLVIAAGLALDTIVVVIYTILRGVQFP